MKQMVYHSSNASDQVCLLDVRRTLQCCPPKRTELLAKQSQAVHSII